VDLFTFILSAQVREVSATVLLVGVVTLILTGQLVPGRTHKRELEAAVEVGEQHRLASEKKDTAITALLLQNSNLLAGVRIADKFYRDFIPAPDERTTPRSEVPDVRT
jgi:hypothetical protein